MYLLREQEKPLQKVQKVQKQKPEEGNEKINLGANIKKHIENVNIKL